MSQELLVETAGWLGVVACVASYLLLSVDKLKSNQYTFHLLNMIGAVGLIVDAAYFQDLPNLVVNVIWLSIGLFSVMKKAVSSGRAQN